MDKLAILKNLVKDYRETDVVNDLGWRESYNNFLDEYINAGVYFEDLEPVNEDDLKNMCDFWNNRSLVKDYITYAYYTITGEKTGRVLLQFDK